MRKKTLDEIRSIPGPYLMPADIAPYLRIDPQIIRVMARTQKPKPLPFQVELFNSWTRIVKGDFIRWAEEQEGLRPPCNPNEQSK